MSELERLELQSLGLSPGELAKFRAWFLESDAKVWDRQIEADLKAGKLDELVDQALADFKAGKATDL